MFYKLLGGFQSHDLLIVLWHSSKGSDETWHKSWWTRTVFSEENVCPQPVWTDLLLEKVVSIIHLFLCVWSMGAIFQNQSPRVTLKMGSRSPKSNQFLSLFQQYGCTSLVKMHPFILEIGCRKAIFQQSEPSCDLENRVKFTKSNQFFFMSQQYSCASLVKIHPFLHEIGCRQAIFQQSKPLRDLENGLKVTKI